jgi:serine protease inhibitor
MNMRLVKLAAILTLGFVGLASQSFPMKSDLKPAGEPVKGDAAVAPYSAFGIDLYLRTAAADPGRNVFISPASVGLALAMAWNGSAGETQAAMAATLRLPSSEFAVVNAADSKLMAAMKAEKRDVELSVANSLWARKGIEFKKPFLARNERFYDADVRTLNFDDPSSPGVINAWVAGKTKDKIREIVDRIDASAILYLINAIYFKGSWAMEFDPKFTRDQAFHAASGEKRTRMMHRSGKFSYRESNDGQAVRLPYGDGQIAMYVFLPARTSSLAKFQANLTAEAWKRWQGEFTKREGHLALPRFTIEYQTKLGGPLTELGMGVAFDRARADFSGMINALAGTKACIHDVIHKTFCEVNEEGTEAAAVTGVEVMVASFKPVDRFEMICDRPFFFAIVDDETGLILFIGSLENPSIS